MHWSFSSLMTYEQCAYRFKLRYIDRLPEPPRPPDNPLERGNRIHSNLEKFTMGELDEFGLTAEPKHIQDFKPALVHLRELYQRGMATVEQDWVYDQNWQLTEKNDPEKYLWVKLDFSVIDEANKHVIVADFKTGKSQYKGIEHVQQTQLYAAAVTVKFPWVQRISSEVWYLDEGWVRSAEHTFEEAQKYIGRFDARAQRALNDKFYRPNPTAMTCRYCPYGPKNGTGACPVGV